MKPDTTRMKKWDEDLFYMILCLLKTGRFHYDIGRELGVSCSYVSAVFSSWITFLSIELKALFEMKTSPDNVAPCYKEYEGLRLIIDCAANYIACLTKRDLLKLQESGHD